MTDADVAGIRMALEAWGFKTVTKELVRDAVVRVAAEREIDTAQLWLRGLVWDGVRRVDSFLVRCMGVVDDEYAVALGRYMWTAQAGRVLQPGVKADMCVIFEGGQGTVKSSTIEALAPGEEYAIEVDLARKEEETVRMMRGVLVAEIAELSGLHTRDLESVKKFISRRKENWIPKYKEFATSFWRRLVFYGTTNRTDILADETGERRWLPVHVERSDVALIVRERDQLWAEGAAMFEGRWQDEAGRGVGAGVAWGAAEAIGKTRHGAYTIEDPWAERVADWLLGVDPFEDADSMVGVSVGRGSLPFSASDLMSGALSLTPAQQDGRAQRRVSAILKRMGYMAKTVREGGITRRRWVKAV